MAWPDSSPNASLHQWALDWALHAQSRLNQTTVALHSTLNVTGNALALGAQPYHDDIRALGAAIGTVPYHTLIFFHGMFTTANMRPLPFRPYFLLCFWTCLMSGYGGGTLTNLMLQEPFLWCRDDWVLPLFAVAWWLIMYCPGDLGFRAFRTPLVKLVCRTSAAILRGRVILSRLELSVLKFSSHAIVAPLFFGTLGGCAGKLSVDLALHLFSPGHRYRPPEILHPGWFLWSAFLISMCYMSFVHWLHILPRDIAFVLVISSLIGHGILEEVLGTPVDLTLPFANLLHTALRIPRPPPYRDVQTASQGAKQSARNGEYVKKVS